MVKGRKLFILAVALTVIWIILPGCSRLNDATIPTVPTQYANNPLVKADSDGSRQGNHQLWGFWLARIDPRIKEWETIPVRSAGNHWNVLKWLEQSPCGNCLKIVDMSNSDHGTKLVTVSLRHPFTSPNLTGFDVRGIAMFRGSHMFPVFGLNISDRAMGDPELINADGYCSLYNFTTLGQGPGGLQGYLKGKFATASVPDARVNGFKRFVSGGGANTRNAFYAGEIISQTYDIYMPAAPFVLGYAVDASWAPPTNKPVTDPMTDFPPEANCLEAYDMDVTAADSYLTDMGGTAKLLMNVYSIPTLEYDEKPVLECPELFDSQLTAFIVSLGEYKKVISNANLAPPGEYKVLISFEDNQNQFSPSWIDLTAYQVYTVIVEKDAGWAKTWGGTGLVEAKDVTIDDYGCIYVVGGFQGTVDFDPGPGVVERTSNGSNDAFFCKYDPLGNLIWVKTWGGLGDDTAEAIALDFGGFLSVVGSFQLTVDFDPGPAIVNVTSNGGYDAYLSEFANDGDLFKPYLRTWGGTGNDHAYDIVLMLDALVIAGAFEETVEFPYWGSVTSNGQNDAYLWSIGQEQLSTWGGTGPDAALGLAATDYDLLVTGYFSGVVNFDSNGLAIYISNGDCDAFMARYHYCDDWFVWCRTWGGPGFDIGIGACMTADRAYATGSYADTVNFNTDSGGDPCEYTANGVADGFVTSFDWSGNFNNATSWGGDDPSLADSGQEICADPTGNIFIAGMFTGSAFGYPSEGKQDCFVARCAPPPSLMFQWSSMWGGTQNEYCPAIAVDGWDRTFIAGSYESLIVDFNPGPDVDNHHNNNDHPDAFLMKLLPDGQW
jgi:hypothetical protein